VWLQVWQALIENSAYDSDREVCFEWFARVSMDIIFSMCVCLWMCANMIKHCQVIVLLCVVANCWLC